MKSQNTCDLEFVRVPVASYTQKISNTINEFIKFYGSKFSEVAAKSDFSEKIYNSTNNLAIGVVGKMREYGDALAGKADSNTVTMLKQHFNMVEDLRKNNPSKYKKLVYFAFVYPTLSFDNQAKQLVSFFMDFANE
jgi:hypothetical protein